jgi:hypothetical protein
MIRHLVKMLTLTLAMVLVVASLALAAGPIMGQTSPQFPLHIWGSNRI